MIEYHIFPFGVIKANSNVIIYGMGDVGKQYTQQVLSTQYCNILYAVDQDYDGCTENLVSVYSPNKLKEPASCFDAIVIALGDKKTANKIRNLLVSWGIPKDKIIYKDSMCAISDRNELMFKNINSISYLESKVRKMDQYLYEQTRNIQTITNYINNSFLSEYGYYTGLSVSKTEYFRELRHLLHLKGVQGEYSMIRVGNANDGGYVMLDDFKGKNIAYSFGIGNNVAWDLEMVQRGFDVYMYDHTIDDLPEPNEHFHFQKKGIGSEMAVVQNEKLVTLRQALENNHHSDISNIILKVDVEGAEWEVLAELPYDLSNQFSQITVELHNFTTTMHRELILKALEKISRTHQLVYLHGNNYGVVDFSENVFMPDTLEVTFLNRNEYQFIEVDKICPAKLDAPCNPAKPDIFLGDWNKIPQEE